MKTQIQADTYFDGARLHRDGPFLLEIEHGVCTALRKENAQGNIRRGRLLMPRPVEAHAHLFLDGDELDPERRAAYLKAPREKLLECARSNVRRYSDAGIGVIRDAGDVHGINFQVRGESARDGGPRILAAGHGLRREGRYGSFLAKSFDPATGQTLGSVIAPGSDFVKIVLTGIIDFKNGVVKGEPQFSLADTSALVAAAHAHGLKTLAHCSGAEGLRIAVAAGIDTVEHGFFMEENLLGIMAEKQIAWTPTLIPVQFHCEHPEYGGWDRDTVDSLQRILDHHRKCLLKAEALGIPILTGSDAGSYGVPHATGLWKEMELLRQTGLCEETILSGAVYEPRRLFGLPPARIAVGEPADWILIRGNRFDPEDFEFIFSGPAFQFTVPD